MSNCTMLEQLRDLRLPGFIEGLAEQRTSSRYHELPFDERLAMLVDREVLRRTNARLQNRIKNARIRFSVTLDDVNFIVPRGVVKQSFLELATCHWVTERLSLIITGPTGVGKSFFASVLSDQACKLGFTTLYTRASDLIAELLMAKTDASFLALRAKLRKVDLLVIDDWLRDPFESAHAREFLDLLDDRYRKASCLFASQLPVEDWHKNIADPTLADAIMDRLVHDTLRLKLDGPSMRAVTSPIVAAKEKNKKVENVAALRKGSKKSDSESSSKLDRS